jgi:hypothetical protein
MRTEQGLLEMEAAGLFCYQGVAYPVVWDTPLLISDLPRYMENLRREILEEASEYKSCGNVSLAEECIDYSLRLLRWGHRCIEGEVCPLLTYRSRFFQDGICSDNFDIYIQTVFKTNNRIPRGVEDPKFVLVVEPGRSPVLYVNRYLAFLKRGEGHMRVDVLSDAAFYSVVRDNIGKFALPRSKHEVVSQIFKFWSLLTIEDQPKVAVTPEPCYS